MTLEIDLPTDTAATVVVEYAGTRHHVPLAPRAWQPITLYNPDERIIYLRLDLPAAPAAKLTPSQTRGHDCAPFFKQPLQCH